MSVTSVAQKVDNKVFPKLMTSKGSGAIVLFDLEHRGTVVCVGHDKTHHLGYYSANWMPQLFDEYHGKVIITGE